MSQSKAVKKLKTLTLHELTHFKDEDGHDSVIGGARALKILQAVQDMDMPDTKDDLFRWIEDIAGLGPKTAWALVGYLDPGDLPNTGTAGPE